LLSIVRRDEPNRKVCRVGGRTGSWRPPTVNLSEKTLKLFWPDLERTSKDTTLSNNQAPMKTNIPSLILISLLTGFLFLHRAHAVVPPPDGGYPGFNTAEGQNALFSLTSGAANTAVGWFSLRTETTGSFNTGVGAGTLVLNTGDENTAIGAAALLLNTATGNTAVGSRALLNNTSGFVNAAVGGRALTNNTTGNSNVAFGVSALEQHITGDNNVAVGYGALASSTDAPGNVAVGAAALSAVTTGAHNVGVGLLAGINVTTASNIICIGDEVFGADVDNSCYVGNIWAQPGGSQAVFVDANGKLGAQVSSRRFKEEIKQMDEASQALFALTPVSFRYKKEIDPTGRAQFGLVAEDVAKVSPDLVISDKEGKPYTVRYDQVNAMLLNEFLKEHKAFVEEQRKVQEQGTTIARLEQQVEALTAGLQKVSTQLELNKAAPRTVLNNQ
jgi:Chaperone of endosialidase